MTMKRPQPQDIVKFKQASKAAAIVAPSPKDDGSVFSNFHYEVSDWGNYWRPLGSSREKQQHLKRTRARMARRNKK